VGERIGRRVVSGPWAWDRRSSSRCRVTEPAPVLAKRRSPGPSGPSTRTAIPSMSGSGRGRPTERDGRTRQGWVPGVSSSGTPVGPPGPGVTTSVPRRSTPRGCSGLAPRTTATAPKAARRAWPTTTPPARAAYLLTTGRPWASLSTVLGMLTLGTLARPGRSGSRSGQHRRRDRRGPAASRRAVHGLLGAPAPVAGQPVLLVPAHPAGGLTGQQCRSPLRPGAGLVLRA